MKCIFCNSPAEKEHVFPKWLLRDKALYNQRLNLLNGTSIPYRQATIPLCFACNNIILSKIEKKIKNGNATALEYYLWSLKIYVGILFKETTLLLNRKLKNNTTILKKEEIAFELTIAKNIFSIYKNKGSFYPNPPGSIIRVPRTGENRYFDCSNILLTPILGIALPNEFIFSLPFDKGRMAKATDIKKISKDMDELMFRFLIADMGYLEFRWGEGFPSLTVNNIIHVSSENYLEQPPRPFKDKEFKVFLKILKIKGSKKNGKWYPKWLSN